MAFKFYPSQKTLDIQKIRKSFLDTDITNVPKEPGDMYGIVYTITNDLNDKVYVGSTIHYIERANSYIRKYYNPEIATTNRIIHTAILELGIEHFHMTPVYICNSEKSLRKTEVEFIRGLNTVAPNGYNNNEGGEGTILNAAGKRNKSRPMIAVSLVERKLYFSDSGKLIGIHLFNGADRSIINRTARVGQTFHSYYFFYWDEAEIRSSVQRKLDRYTELIGKRSGCIPGRAEEYAQLGNALLDEGMQFFINNEFSAYRIQYSDSESKGYKVIELSLS